jgi:hypothetical protein
MGLFLRERFGRNPNAQPDPIDNRMSHHAHRKFQWEKVPSGLFGELKPLDDYEDTQPERCANCLQ